MFVRLQLDEFKTSLLQAQSNPIGFVLTSLPKSLALHGRHPQRLLPPESRLLPRMTPHQYLLQHSRLQGL